MADLQKLEESRAKQEARGFNEPAPTVSPPQRDTDRENAKITELGLDTSQITPDIEKDLFEATYSPDELSGITDYKTLVKGQSRLASQASTALGQAQSAFTGFKPEQMMGVLEEALRTKTDVGAQPLGTSDLFKQAGIPTSGVAGFTTLMQSLNQNSKDMQDRYGSFTNVLDKAGKFVGQEYKALADNYQFAIDKYNDERGRLDTMIQNIVQQEQAMDLAEQGLDVWKRQQEFLQDIGGGATITEQLAAEKAGMTIIDGKLVTKGSLDAIKDKPGSSLVGDYQRLFIGSPTNANGIDLAGSPNSEISNSTEGTVISAGEDGGWGNSVRIKDSDGNIHRYSHLNNINQQIANAVGTDTVIQAGAFIGGMGNTGKVMGASGETLTPEQISQGRGTHLDYTVYKPNGSKYNVKQAAAFAGLGISDGGDGNRPRKDAILAQISNGLLTKGDATDIRDEFSNDAPFLAEVTKAFNDPKNRTITDTLATKYNTNTLITKGQFDDTIKARQEAGFGNKLFQGAGEKEYGNLVKWLEMDQDIKSIRALKEGGDYIKTLTPEEQNRIFNEYKDTFGVDSVEDLLKTDITNTGPLTGRTLGFRENLPGRSEKERRQVELDVISGKYKTSFMKEISGVAIAEPEAIRLGNLVPHIKLQDSRFDSSARDAQDSLNSDLLGAANRFGFETIDELRSGTEKTRAGEFFEINDSTVANNKYPQGIVVEVDGIQYVSNGDGTFNPQ